MCRITLILFFSSYLCELLLLLLLLLALTVHRGHRSSVLAWPNFWVFLLFVELRSQTGKAKGIVGGDETGTEAATCVRACMRVQVRVRECVRVLKS